ncbi:YfhO family protein [Fulvivirga aurantia]|uniref:YfhO family protein n=1 Tax=Fulvivirga aurantia TaxID=2529383 RepID=UPI00162A1934|nr:YfhO family protein [Fulvivirga aurantia]
MKNIKFTQHILPHLVAIITFLIVTLIFFKPFFFDNKNLDQHDINQWRGGAQELIEYREATGEEGLWTNSMFGGMPGYFVDVKWSDGLITTLKGVLVVGLPHPVRNIFLAFISFYILLLAFKVRPYLAIGGALAFGLSSFLIIGLGAGHNARIGAIALMPLVLAGIHITFTRHKLLGFGVTAAALALELRENHLQITYYLLLMVLVYGLIMLIDAVKKGEIKPFATKLGILIVAAILAVGTFAGKFWSTYEYSKYSMRGPSELKILGEKEDNTAGLNKDYAFQYSNGILEPLTLIIPNYYGGASSNYLVQDEDSQVLKALQRAGDQQTANQLARYTSAYWGNQPLTAPYYAGAIICFLFVIGLVMSDKKYVIWLSVVTALAIILSWGDSFKAFNYFMFDYFPGYNKFRSVTFALTMAFVAIPLLGFIGLEKLLEKGLNKQTQKKLITALGVTGGFCLLVVVFAGMASFTRPGEEQLPAWFLNALSDDREGLMRGDAFRSLIFIVLAGAVAFLRLKKVISYPIMGGIFALLILIDLAAVDSRYFGENNYKRSADRSFFQPTDADKEILKDNGKYRVYNLQGAMNEARTSYHHHSLGGYHGAKMRRYQDLYDHCIQNETQQMIQSLQSGNQDLSGYGVVNMLNTKYLTFGAGKNAIIPNIHANGNAWFVSKIIKANSPDEELSKTCDINTSNQAVVDISKFEIDQTSFNTSGTIALEKYTPNKVSYTANVEQNALAVFSEIYYPVGWKATIDGKEAQILRANYVLRALKIPDGQHKIEFTFEPDSYYVGDKITFASSLLLILLLIGSLGLTLKQRLN